MSCSCGYDDNGRGRLVNPCRCRQEAEALRVEIGQKQSRIERLEAALNAAAGALTYYTEVEYDVSSDVQSGYGIEVLNEIEAALSETTKESGNE